MQNPNKTTTANLGLVIWRTDEVRISVTAELINVIFSNEDEDYLPL
jgi:hypothetical protein